MEVVFGWYLLGVIGPAYRALFLVSHTLMGAKELWKTNAPPRVKYFFWLVLHRTYERPSKASRSRCLCSQTLMPVLSALSTLTPSTICSARGMYACIFSNEIWSRRILGTLGFIRGDAPSLTSRVVLHSGPGGSLLGSKCQSRHVGASTNRLVGTAGWLDVVEGKKQLAERSDFRVPGGSASQHYHG